MDRSAEQFVALLSSLAQKVDEDIYLVDELYDAVDLLDSSDTVREVFPAIFEFFEQHPAAELGEPGPLVHLIEESYPGGYEEQLLESLARKPVHHTVWMANRLLNNKTVVDPLRSHLQFAIRNTPTHPLADESARRVAVQFIGHQGL